MSVEVRRARDDDERAAGAGLADAVFGGEQGVATQVTPPEPGVETVRLVAVDADGVVLGTCRLLLGGSTARLGSLAVRRELRGRGYGSALLTEASREARATGAVRIRLHAQMAALSLYERAGYFTRGDRFVAEGIEHVTMERTL